MKKPGETLELDFETGVWMAGEKRKTRFATLLGKPTVVSVYMRNNTPRCDSQIASLAEGFARIEAAGWSAIGLSKDTVGSHAKYAAKFGVRFPLVSDPEHSFARATDSLVEKKLYGRAFIGPLRAAYLIDGDGKLLHVIEPIDASNHAEEILAAIAAV